MFSSRLSIASRQASTQGQAKREVHFCHLRPRGTASPAQASSSLLGQAQILEALSRTMRPLLSPTGKGVLGPTSGILLADHCDHTCLCTAKLSFVLPCEHGPLKTHPTRLKFPVELFIWPNAFVFVASARPIAKVCDNCQVRQSMPCARRSLQQSITTRALGRPALMNVWWS
jgi:hypothetical protein